MVQERKIIKKIIDENLDFFNSEEIELEQ